MTFSAFMNLKVPYFFPTSMPLFVKQSPSWFQTKDQNIFIFLKHGYPILFVLYTLILFSKEYIIQFFLALLSFCQKMSTKHNLLLNYFQDLQSIYLPELHNQCVAFRQCLIKQPTIATSRQQPLIQKYTHQITSPTPTSHNRELKISTVMARFPLCMDLGNQETSRCSLSY